MITSTNRHGVHSPFVYNLVTKCFNDKTNYGSYSELKHYLNALLQNNQQLAVTDFGAGSRLKAATTRSVKSICKTSGTPLRRAKLLFRLVQYFKPKTILELGTSLGIATHAMALGNPQANITSIEGCPNISAFTKKQLQQFKITNATLENGTFKSVLKTLNEPQWDMVFFDGHHNKEATLSYFETLLHTAHNESLFIFDDIYWSKDMAQAWNIIKQHPKVTVTVDTFYWGLVFFRKEQVKEHFIVRV